MAGSVAARRAEEAGLDPDQLALGIAWYAVFLFSTTCHEAAHAWAAHRGGDPTAYLGGQVSLDPRPHLRREPVGLLVVPVLSFALGGWMIGWASTPYDPRWAERWPRRAAWMSLAGPAANGLLVLLAAAVIRTGVELGAFEPPVVPRVPIVTATGGTLAHGVALLAGIFFTLNLLLLCFNLLPLPPLDGAGALPLLLGERAAGAWQRMARQPVIAILGLLIAWNLFGAIFARVLGVALALLYTGTSFG